MSETEKLKVLILDDNEDDVKLAKLYLSTIEYDCAYQHVETKDEFESAVSNFLPDIILTDYKLPGYDGVQAIQYVTANFPTIPIIMITGTLGEELAAKIIKMGACDFVLKENVNRIRQSVMLSLREAEEKRKKFEAEEALRQNYDKLLRSQFQLLSSQINPHFMFNSLSSIQYYIKQNRNDEAVDYLLTFAQLIRSTLMNSGKTSVPISEELEFLNLYLTSECNRLRNQFDFEFEVDEKIDKDATCVPPMILQPYIENSIVHGIAPLEERRGKITISITKNDDDILTCRVADNGVGRKKKSLTTSLSSHVSVGIDITRTRLELLTQMFGENFNFKIKDLKDRDKNPMGTRVEIQFPANYN